MATRRLAFDNEVDDKIEDDDDLFRVNRRALMIFTCRHDDFGDALLPQKTMIEENIGMTGISDEMKKPAGREAPTSPPWLETNRG